MIQPVIVAVDGNFKAVQRLVNYCEKLDGTKVKIVRITPADDAMFTPFYPDNAKACRAAFSLRTAAESMSGKPFIWLEQDAVPLQAGWAKRLSTEYKRLKKPFMLSSDSNPPDDLVGGIGVYSGDTRWMIPQHFPMEPFRAIGWDLWMMRNLAPLISRTPLIQHSYGIYDANHIASDHVFPRDAHMLRDGAVIFHRDVTGSLMEECSRTIQDKTFAHAGDLGDIIYHLETIRRMGGGHLMLGSDLGLPPNLPSHCREPMTTQRIGIIAPLLRAQPYILSVNRFEGPPDPAWINLNRFRETFKPKKESAACQSLQRASLRRFNLSVQDETKPWLTVKHVIPTRQRICVARSPRYHHAQFPWKELVNKYGAIMDFIGLPREHESFEAEFGKVRYCYTPTLLETAKDIDEHAVFVGNQSCPFAIAEGLKVPAVQETWPPEPNCLFHRPDLLAMTTDIARITAFIERHLSMANIPK